MRGALVLSILAISLLAACRTWPPALTMAGGAAYQYPVDAFEGLPGLDGRRLLIGVGELHGARENSATVQALVIDLRRRGFEVRLFLEQPDDGMQLRPSHPNAFYESLRRSEFWSGEWRDGRAGTLKACMLYGLGKAGIAMTPIDRRIVTKPADGEVRVPRDEFMAQRVVDSLRDVESTKKVAAIVWVGNYHVYTPPGQAKSTFDIIRSSLPDWPAVTLYLGARNGSAFNCRSAGCGVYPLRELSTISLGLSAQPSGEYQFIVETFHPDAPAAIRLEETGSFQEFCR